VPPITDPQAEAAARILATVDDANSACTCTEPPPACMVPGAVLVRVPLPPEERRHVPRRTSNGRLPCRQRTWGFRADLIPYSASPRSDGPLFMTLARASRSLISRHCGRPVGRYSGGLSNRAGWSSQPCAGPGDGTRHNCEPREGIGSWWGLARRLRLSHGTGSGCQRPSMPAHTRTSRKSMRGIARYALLAV